MEQPKRRSRLKTMALPTSLSDTAAAFDRLHPQVQRWVRAQGWSQLREVQARAITAIGGHRRDVLIAATTAAGKTEAAFLPLLGAAAARQHSGVAILYVAPLKALINDQHKRLEGLCADLEIGLTRWHGDAPQSPKTRLLKSPGGVVLITPESIEAMFVRRPASIEAMFGRLDAIVIDELHAFLQGPRGLHLWSLLHRIDAISHGRARRIGLSATLGDKQHAADWLAGGAPQPEIIAVDGGGAPLKLRVRAVVEPPETSPPAADLQVRSALAEIARHAHEILRGKNNLFFAGSRANVEALADRLRTLSEDSGVPNEFFPHHGSLAKELREEVETRLKEDRFPTTAVATTTLELGIDIGSVHSVAQLGAPRSVASLRQRLGRSGRREGSAAIFRGYVREPYLAADADPLDRLHLPVAQSVAALHLLAERFVEPPLGDPALLSVTVHQLLSRIAERGAQRADQLYRAIGRDGPFAAIEPGDFADLLRGLGGGEEPMLEQAPDGSLMLGPLGERLTASRDFYANFKTDEEWRLVHQGRALGTLPIVNALAVGSILSFAGRRWRAIAIDDPAKVVEVVAHRAGRIPKFDRVSGEPIHDRLAGAIRDALVASDMPAYLDPVAAQLLAEGRELFALLDLARTPLIAAGKDTHLMTWRGSVANGLFAVLLGSVGFECETFDVGVTLLGTPSDEAAHVLGALDGCPPIETLGRFVSNLAHEKYDDYIPEDLLRRFWIKRHAHLETDVTDMIRSIALALS